MPDEKLLRHIKAIFDEASLRPSLTKNVPSTSSQVTEELNKVEIRDPKHEMQDEQYLSIFENPSGVQYNQADGSFSWNNRFHSDNSVQYINVLNNYGCEGADTLLNQSDSSDETDESIEERRTPRGNRQSRSNLTSKPSAKYWTKRGGDPIVNCSCSICGSKFSTIRCLLDHRHQEHSLKDMMMCGLCGKEFSKRTHIYLHLSQEYKVYHCDGCNTSFASKWHLEKHRCKENETIDDKKRRRTGRVNAEEIKVIKEEIQDEEFGGVVLSNENHEKSKEDRFQFACVLCGKKYQHYHWLLKHRTKCLETTDEIQEFKCNVCYRRYNSSFWFERHMEKCNSSTALPPALLDQTISCPNCHKKYQNEYWFDYHKKHCPDITPALSDVHLDVNSLRDRRPREGEISVVPDVNLFGIEPEREDDNDDDEDADATISSSSSSTGNLVNIPCSICGKFCVGVASLLHHRKQIHGLTAMLTCGVCTKKFNTLSSIRRHMSMEYSIFRCQQCGRNCIDRTTLDRHECFKPYKIRDKRLFNIQNISVLKCPDCRATFANLNVLSEHRKTCQYGNVFDNIQQPGSSSLRQHHRSDTNGAALQRKITSRVRLDSNTPEKWTCRDCHASFHNLQALCSHRHESHGKEMFQCNNCSETLPNYRALHDHNMMEQ